MRKLISSLPTFIYFYLLPFALIQNSSAQTSVVLPGTFQSELGCASDWMPDCNATALTYDAVTGLWSGTFVINAGWWEYKVAYNGSWAINYGDSGVQDGPNIQLYVPCKSDVTFTYDPVTHLVTSTPRGAPPSKVSLYGDLQSELGCPFDWYWDCINSALSYSEKTGKWQMEVNLPAGCYSYTVMETSDCGSDFYGQDGVKNGAAIQIYLSSSEEVTFTYDAATHVMNTSPFGPPPPGVTKVSLIGTLQNELGCGNDNDYNCDNPSLSYNSTTGKWEGKFYLVPGCYSYQVKETVGCNTVAVYGDNGIVGGSPIQLSIPTGSEISFSYDPQTHLITSSPYSGAPQGATKVSLIGDLQSELGCSSDWYWDCENAALSYDDVSGKWLAKYTLPAGCYTYQVKETTGCSIVNIYGENGVPYGNSIQLYLPQTAEITFTYDPETHIISSSPYSGAPQGLNLVSLIGSLQSELGCANDNEYNCNVPSLYYDAGADKWIGKYTLPAGCYTYQVKETIGCNTVNIYGENGTLYGNSIQLYVPQTAEVTFTYDAQMHMMSTAPYGAAPGVTKVSLYGDLQSETGCSNDFDYSCDNAALVFNASSGKWEGKFTLPNGCYSYFIKETVGCYNTSYYGENGEIWTNPIHLFIPDTTETTFSYDPETHIVNTTPYSGAPQQLFKVSLLGNLQSETGCSVDYDYYCDNPSLTYDSASQKWIGKHTLPAGCYTYVVKETIGCNTINTYGEGGVLYGAPLQLYSPQTAEITFTYDAQTHLISTAPYGAPTGVTKVSLRGDLQSETGCDYDFYDYCDKPALTYNSATGKWEGKFTLPAGCYAYQIKETIGCDNTTLYGENGQMWGNLIQLYIPQTAEIIFTYDAQTHIIASTPYKGMPVTGVSLVGDLQKNLGCTANWDDSCDNLTLTYNATSGLWEGTFSLDAGCYKYVVKQSKPCGYVDIYGADGTNYANEYYNYYQLYLPAKTDVIFKYNDSSHLISCDYNDVCPPETVVIPGNFQSELGCHQVVYGLPDGDWEPACDLTRLTFDPTTKLFVGTFNIPAGYWEFKVAYNDSWAENYGLDGLRDGPNIPLGLCVPSQVTFKYNYKTHLVALEFNPTAICINKFYDANVNGINDDGMPLEGVKFTLSGNSNAVQFTNGEGAIAFTPLNEGYYTVTETLQGNWQATTPTMQSIQLTNPTTLSFGNVCLGAGGGHGIGFWASKNGEAVLNDGNTMVSELGLLASLNLKDGDGKDFDPVSYKEFVSWLKNANAKNMAYMLSAQLAAMRLSVEAGFVDDNSMLFVLIGDQLGIENFISVARLTNKVNEYLGWDGYTPARDENRSIQEFLKDALEKANNNLIFVQSKPCNEFYTSADKIAREIDFEKTSALEPKIWPNPSHGYFILRPVYVNPNENIYIKVMDGNGKQVYAVHGNAARDYHFGENFSAGLYLVQIIQGTSEKTIKIVKQ